LHTRLATCWFIFFVLSSVNVEGQQEISEPAKLQPKKKQEQQERLPRTISDSLSVTYFMVNDLSTDYEITDTLFDDFEKYAEARQFRTGAFTLGNLGSSHYNIIYSPRKEILTDAGFHQYDNYKLAPEDLRYYKLTKAYNDLFFSPVAGQENFLVKAKFSTNFTNDLNLAIDYKRINQEGFYSSQNTKSTSFGMGLWKNNKEKNHQLFISLVANNHNENQNGGIITPFSGVIRDRTGEAFYLTAADTRHQHFTYSLDNFWSLSKAQKYSVHHQLKVDDGYYRYSDQGAMTSRDSTYYGEQFVTDTRGLRYLLDFIRYTNTVDLSFDTNAVGLELGLLYQHARFNSDAGRAIRNDLIAFGQVKTRLKNIAELTGRLELGLSENVGNFKAEGCLQLEPVKGVKVTGKILAQRYDPAIIEESLSLTFVPVYNNDFRKINEVVLSGNIFWDKINTELEFNSGIIDNPIGFNTFALPFQSNGSTEYIQLLVNQRLQYKFLGLENAVVYQSFTDNLYQLPKLYGIHNAFVQFYLFKKNLLTRVGGLYYSLQSDAALAFSPVTGRFFPTDDRSTVNPNYPYYEFYSDFKISQFRLYIKLENANDLFIKDEFYQIHQYPQFDWKLRVGIRWVIRD